MDHPEGAGSQRAYRVDFDRRVRLEFRGAQISSDGGLLVMREMDDALGLSDLASAALCDNRRGKNTIHRLDGLFRQSVFGRLAGYEDVNDADRLALDPVMRQVVGGRAVDARAASASQMGRFETETLALPENREALADLNGQWIDRFHDRNGLKYIVLDMDSSVSPTHGDQEGAAWNGHFDCTCYHPNFLFNQFGMLERCALRNGNVHSADGWRDVLDPVIARYADRDLGGRFFRADAAYAIPAIYERLEEAGYFYAIRLPANNVLREKIAHRLTRPVGRPSLTKVKRFFEDFHYQAASWCKERRVIAKIEWHPGELFPKIGFIVTNLPMEPDWVVRFYNLRISRELGGDFARSRARVSRHGGQPFRGCGQADRRFHGVRLDWFGQAVSQRCPGVSGFPLTGRGGEHCGRACREWRRRASGRRWLRANDRQAAGW